MNGNGNPPPPLHPLQWFLASNLSIRTHFISTWGLYYLWRNHRYSTRWTRLLPFRLLRWSLSSFQHSLVSSSYGSPWVWLSSRRRRRSRYSTCSTTGTEIEGLGGSFSIACAGLHRSMEKENTFIMCYNVTCMLMCLSWLFVCMRSCRPCICKSYV